MRLAKLQRAKPQSDTKMLHPKVGARGRAAVELSTIDEGNRHETVVEESCVNDERVESMGVGKEEGRSLPQIRSRVND